LARLGLASFLVLPTIANARGFRREIRHKKSLTKLVRETLAYVGTTTVFARNRLNALRSSHASYSGLLWRKQTTNRPVFPMKSLALAQQFVRDVLLTRRLEKDVVLASRRLERLVKKSSDEQGRTQDYTDALKPAKTTVLLCGSNAQR
jgi:hypothetical protein